MIPMRLSTSRSNRPPPSLVIAPPSNWARIWRCFRGSNSKPIWLHSVVIRLSLLLGRFSFGQKSYARNASLFLLLSEILRLVVEFRAIGPEHRHSPYRKRLGSRRIRPAPSGVMAFRLIPGHAAACTALGFRGSPQSLRF